MRTEYTTANYQIINVSRNMNIYEGIVHFDETNYDHIESYLKDRIIEECPFKEFINVEWKHYPTQYEKNDHIDYTIEKSTLTILAKDIDDDIIKLTADIEVTIENIDDEIHYYQQLERFLLYIFRCQTYHLENLVKLMDTGDFLDIIPDEIIEGIDDLTIENVLKEYMDLITLKLNLLLKIRGINQTIPFNPDINQYHAKFNNILDQVIWDNNFTCREAFINAVTEKLKEVQL